MSENNAFMIGTVSIVFVINKGAVEKNQVIYAIRHLNAMLAFIVIRLAYLKRVLENHAHLTRNARTAWVASTRIAQNISQSRQ
jgi:hypothetical protein